MAFLTDIDSRAQIKGSRDPLALVPIWSFLGRKVVGNLSTVTSSVRGFTTLLLGYYFAREIEDVHQHTGGSALSTFLKFEQLAGYSRFYFKKDSSFRGIERAKLNLNDPNHIYLSTKAEDQILSNQKVYGLWGLYSVPSRASGLLEKDEIILTVEARSFVEKQYIDHLTKKGFTEGRILIDLLKQDHPQLHLTGKHADLCRAIAKIHDSNFTKAELAFYRERLMLGGPKDITGGLQTQLVDLLETLPTVDSPHLYLKNLIHAAQERGEPFSALTQCLTHIDYLESLIAPSAIVFGFILSRNGQTVPSTAAELHEIWGNLQFLNLEGIQSIAPEIVEALGDSDSGIRWLKVTEA
jgi:hypothetical protein